MCIATRIRKIREIKGWKQSSVASTLNITQQAYSCMEQEGNNIKFETLQRYCRVMQVQLSLLVASDVPITEETLQKYGTISFGEIIHQSIKMENRIEVYQELLQSR